MGPHCRQLQLLAAAAIALTALALPAISLGHQGGEMDTIEEHIEEDSVSYTPAEARRMERRTAAVTADDARAAAAAVSSNPGVSGQWGPVVPWPAVAIHVALLINGKVLAFDTSIPDDSDLNEASGTSDTFTRATVWDPVTEIHTKANADTGVNIFCAGLAHLMDGRIFLAGGNKSTGFIGIDATNVFDGEDDNSWTLTEDMEYERWYPSVTPLANGEMLITEGHDPNDPDEEHIPEVREVDGSIRQLDNAPLRQDLYPWMDVAPDGRAFHSGPWKVMNSLDPSGEGSWTPVDEPRDDEFRSYGSHALYDIGKILVSGGGENFGPDDVSSNTAVDIDLNGPTPVVEPTGSMELGRRQHNLTVLADGTVLATGGNYSGETLVDRAAGVYNAELWDPDTGQWTKLAAEDKTRQYHSTALLLPDGRVLSAGGGVCGTCATVNYLERNAQVFSPPYLFKQDGSPAPRPVINSAPKAVRYGSPMSINSPHAGAIGKVALMRLGAVTHSVNMEQRYVPLSYSASGTTITATSPLNANIAPPGYYMLFLIGTDGVPSEAKMVRVDPVAPPRPAAPTGLATVPAPPRNNNGLAVTGTAEAGSTVKLYSTSDCTGTPLATGTAADFASPGFSVSVGDNTTTSFRASATNSSENPSACSAPYTYIEDSDAPATPSGIASAPGSPVNNNGPRINGTADAGSTVQLYSDSNCLGTVHSSGTAAAFASPGLTAMVVDNTTTNFRATATDAAGNVSPCSSPLAYVEDSTGPETVAEVSTDGDSATVTFTSEPNASFTCALDGGEFAECRSPAIFEGLTPGGHTVRVRSRDSVGNAEPEPAELAFTIEADEPPADSTAPDTRITKKPKAKTANGSAVFRFASSEPESTFRCKVDGATRSCGYRLSMVMEPGKHQLTVAAIDPAGNVDRSPERWSWRVKRTRGRSRIGEDLLLVAAAASGSRTS